jgi:hypothetical protein
MESELAEALEESASDALEQSPRSYTYFRCAAETAGSTRLSSAEVLAGM